MSVLKKLFFVFVFILYSIKCYSQSGWVNLNTPSGSECVDMDFLNSKTGFIINYNSNMLITTDGGLNWVIKNTPGFSNTSSVSFVNNLTGFLSQSNEIYKTTNGGINWGAAYLINPRVYLNKIRFIDAMTGYACGDRRGILKTTDGGSSWSFSLYEYNTSEMLIDIRIVNSETVFVTGFDLFNYPVLYKTINGGENWVNIAPGTGNQTYLQSFFFNSNTGYLLGGGNLGNLLKTTNGGINWTSIITNPFASTLYCTYFFNQSTGFLGNVYGKIYKTTDGGLNLAAQKIGSTHEVRQIEFTGQDTGYAITADGVFKTITGGNTIGINLINNIIPDKYSLSQNYPNPFNPNTVVSYQLPVAGFIQLKVYDVLGNEIETLVNEKQNAGSYSVDFNAASLPSGIYFYKLVTEKFSETKKMILIK